MPGIGALQTPTEISLELRGDVRAGASSEMLKREGDFGA